MVDFCQEVMGNLNAMKYQLLLQRVNLSEWGNVYGGSDFLFMQDNAPPHAVSMLPYQRDFRLIILCFFFKIKAASTLSWLSENEIPILKWPSLFPDLNPMENVSAQLTKDVYGKGKSYNLVSDLKEAIYAVLERL